jgi:hypothetical protein
MKAEFIFSSVCFPVTFFFYLSDSITPTEEENLFTGCSLREDATMASLHLRAGYRLPED